MYTQYRPDLKGTVTTNAPGATGDGIVMAEAVGADLVDIEQIQLHSTAEQTTSIMITESVRGNEAILVNSEGKRFINEIENRDEVSAAEITVEADTVEELAEKIELNPATLKETLDNWNAMVAGKDNTEFGRNFCRGYRQGRQT